MDASAINIETCFNLNSTPAGLTVDDKTDYAGEGINPADVVGIIKATGPNNNIFYNNVDYGTPDIDVDVSTISSEIPLLLDVNGDVQKGEYKIVYSIQLSGSTILTKEFTYNFNFDSPEGKLSVTSNINAATLKAKDITDYGIYKDTLVRTMTVKYPQTISPAIADEVTSLEEYTVGPPIYTKTWSVVLSSVVRFVLADGLCVNDTIEAVQDHEVEKNQCLCDSIECMDNLLAAYNSAKCNNPKEANRLEKKLIEAAYLHMLVLENERCGNVEEMEARCVELVALTAAEGCTLSDPDDLPSIIQPLYAGGTGTTAIVQSGGNGILVSSVTVGSTTTYTLNLDQAILDSIGTTWFTGTGAPVSGLGSEGDFYIDTSDVNQPYYKKTDATTWTLQTNLKGADGSTQLNGSGTPASGLGNVGDYYIDTDNGNYYEKTDATTWTLVMNLIPGVATRKFISTATAPFILDNTENVRTVEIEHTDVGPGAKVCTELNWGGSAPTDCQRVTIQNVGSIAIQLEDIATSTPTPPNKAFITGTGANLSITPDNAVEVVFSVQRDAWMVVSKSF